VTFGGSVIPVFIQATQPAIPLWVGAVSIGDGMVLATDGEETASYAWQWAILP